MCACMKMGGWMDGWMDEWMDGWMGGWVDEWMDEWMDEWTDEWMFVCPRAVPVLANRIGFGGDEEDARDTSRQILFAVAWSDQRQGAKTQPFQKGANQPQIVSIN